MLTGGGGTSWTGRRSQPRRPWQSCADRTQTRKVGKMKAAAKAITSMGPNWGAQGIEQSGLEADVEASLRKRQRQRPRQPALLSGLSEGRCWAKCEHSSTTLNDGGSLTQLPNENLKNVAFFLED